MKDKGIIVEVEDRYDFYPEAEQARVYGGGILEIGIIDGDDNIEDIAVYPPGRWFSYRFYGYIEDEVEDD